MIKTWVSRGPLIEILVLQFRQMRIGILQRLDVTTTGEATRGGV